MPETTEDWMRRIGSHEALLERQRARMAGEINAPMKKRRKRYAPVPLLPEKVVTVLPAQKEPKRRSKWKEQRGRSSN